MGGAIKTRDGGKSKFARFRESTWRILVIESVWSILELTIGSGGASWIGELSFPLFNASADTGGVEDEGGGGGRSAVLEPFRFEWRWYVVRETNCARPPLLHCTHRQRYRSIGTVSHQAEEVD